LGDLRLHQQACKKSIVCKGEFLAATQRPVTSGRIVQAIGVSIRLMMPKTSNPARRGWHPPTRMNL
jgi:hypothetical protein